MAKKSAASVTSTSAASDAEIAVEQITFGARREVDPATVLISEELSDLRDRTDDEYQEDIIFLAQSIIEEGQIHPGLVRETPEGLMLIAGQRRLEAIKLLRSEDGPSILGLEEDQAAKAATFLFRVEIRNDVEGDNPDEVAFRLAMMENCQRRKFTPIEFAKDIQVIRKKFKIEDGAGGTQNIADFLKVSAATVTEHERLLKAPKDVQDAVQSGKMSKDSALELMRGVKEEKREDVMSAAQVKANKEAAAKQEAREAKAAEKQAAQDEKDKKAGKSKREHNPTPKVPLYKPGVHKAAAPAKVETKHIREAAKEAGAQSKLQAPKMSEFKELLTAWTGPAFPKVLVKFAEVGLAWTKGEVSDKKFTDAFDDIADELPKVKVPVKPAGKPAAKPVAKPDAKKAATPAKATPKKAVPPPPKKKK